ncbi:MAG: leucine-rich repeat domain-containing protein, partial [Clostridia bacterium]|nr:leucine-rich repeat domain-containing protein [Clostridia bacterium]
MNKNIRKFAVDKNMKYTPKAQFPYDLADFEIKNGVLVKYKGKSTNVVVPSCVTSIGESAFLYSNIAKVTISDSVTTIGQNSFFGCCKLREITIGSGVVSIGDNAFGGCRFLQEITVSENNVKYHSDGNCLIETKSKTVIWGCWKSIIPNDGSEIAIAKHAFWGKCPVISDKIV